MEEMSQIQTIGEPPPKTWDDYRNGCLSTFHGGYHDPKEVEIFQHGMITVFNLLTNELPPLEELTNPSLPAQSS